MADKTKPEQVCRRKRNCGTGVVVQPSSSSGGHNEPDGTYTRNRETQSKHISTQNKARVETPGSSGRRNRYSRHVLLWRPGFAPFSFLSLAFFFPLPDSPTRLFKQSSPTREFSGRPVSWHVRTCFSFHLCVCTRSSALICYPHAIIYT